ncbi:MAG: fused MFS/spermidine synthase, partial [Chloroflexi bacterium]|nr:fused MFS/spermidine synthase [Chloroflexota bacterium]
PYHLTTHEFLLLLKSHLAPDGVYMANTIDVPSVGAFVRAHVRTMQAVFKNVFLVANSADWQTLGRATFVIVATDRALDPQEVMRVADELGYAAVTFIVPPDALAEYLAQEPPLILSDDYAPVDNLLAPTFADRQ